MLTLSDIRDYIDSLGFADKVYIGKMDNKIDNSIGVYERPPSQASIPLGGIQNSSYGIKHISLLIHGNKKIRDTEEVAYDLYDKLLQEGTDFYINDKRINFLYLDMEAPENVGTDDGGIYEYVIWVNFVFER